MFNDLDTLKNNAGDVTVRQQFIGSAQNLATYFNSVYQGLSEIQSSVNEEIKTTVANINAIAEKIATLNKEINVIEIQGGYANELRDQRALLIDELSEIVPTEISEVPVTNSNYPDMPTGANYYTVTIGGQVLVDTYDTNLLECVARDTKVNQSDMDGLYDIKWAKTGNSFQAGASYMSGTLKALFDIRDGNNSQNFTGKTKVIDSSTLQVTNASITSIEAMSMPEVGKLTINGKDYEYSSFDFETDADGNITSYTFHLANGLSSTDISRVDGRKASIGTSVDSMGVPYYQAQMNQFIRSFAEAFNDILYDGEDLNGDKTNYYSFFTGTGTDGDYVLGESISRQLSDGTTTSVSASSGDSTYYKLTAANFGVATICMKDPTLLATTADISGNQVDKYDLVEQLAKLKSDTVIYRNGTADGFLKCMISDISVDTQEAKIFYQNYSNIADNITTQRMSVSSVDEDEEGLDLIKFQNAYNLSSKMVSVMAEIYDRLILETGV
jgi:flagellar hook-associated protein 1 FlgK